MFKVEDGIEMQKISRRGRPAKYPFAAMEVGQSFAFDPDKDNKHGPANNVKSAAYRYGAKHGKKFSTRLVGDVYRCWRVE